MSFLLPLSMKPSALRVSICVSLPYLSSLIHAEIVVIRDSQKCWTGSTSFALLQKLRRVSSRWNHCENKQLVTSAPNHAWEAENQEVVDHDTQSVFDEDNKHDHDNDDLMMTMIPLLMTALPMLTIFTDTASTW